MPRIATIPKPVKWAAAVIAVVVVGAGIGVYWHHSSLHPSTDDAYVQAEVVRIAPRISGQVTEVHVTDHQHVRRGELMVLIDPEPFQVAFARSQAQLASISTEVGALEAAVEAARAAVIQAEAQLANSDIEERRAAALVRRGVAPQARLDDARAQLRTDQGAYEAAKARLVQAQRELGRAGAENARIQAALADVRMARLNLSYTQITAPADGVVGEVDIRPGAMVQAGQNLFPLVEDGSFWVAANFKETDLDHIRTGQPATIEIDISARTYHGVVSSISPASGVAFSLLPPENATGNWVKVTQRFPVKIVPTDADAVPVPWSPWRVGASTTVTVDTTRRAELPVPYPAGSAPSRAEADSRPPGASAHE